ncbi:flagellar hook-length control protein FliK [Pandoraea nosoerga]|uniref:Flagellar hook-length control protein n=1 Tax=Pandoraea nosoerga TaxID=2508296 RepID=A0A5E4WHN7_9BURK|nr:flagellar hook-length control protein FliK [Pandoraea nosoerga]MBN4667382.1 flagellar hook-length control protein FliK [Pandoraea nosoerga]MBN4677302.1 flagellar hook-length control protein FliK [Pandoraea nosoerga]MBN4682423.1 flagellar hook-length control protein FliK [Pandoraea nosoerga]MBN4746780.1 flagellar hook-length control protein FliK [Pandoraea nosoerga]VVE22576.1 flagellar hook-length control protein [Pandoraea nosoerga]
MIAESTPAVPLTASARHRPTPGSVEGSTTASGEGARHGASCEGLALAKGARASTDFAATLRRSLGANAEAGAAGRGVTSASQTPGTAVAAAVAPEFAPPALATSDALGDVERGRRTPGDDALVERSDSALPVHDAGVAPAAPGGHVSLPDDVLAHDSRVSGDAGAFAPIETLLAAHLHRMRGASGTPVSGFLAHARSDGDMASRMEGLHVSQPAQDAMLQTPTAKAEAGHTTPLPFPLLLPGTGRHGASFLALSEGAALRDAGEPSAHTAQTADSASIALARVALAEGGSTGTGARDGIAAVTSEERVGAHVLAGDRPALARALAERVASMTHDGVHEARLRLTPAELGDIGIVVRKSAMQLSVTLQVSRPEVLALVQGTAALLRDMLSQRHTGEVQVSASAMAAFDGGGASGDAPKQRARETPEDDAGPGLALGASGQGQREAQGAFRL